MASGYFIFSAFFDIILSLKNDKERETMFCNKCGANIPDGALFCGKCGGSQTSATSGFQTSSTPPLSQNGAYPQYSQYPVKKKSGCLKWIIILAVIIIVLAVIGYVVGSFLDSSAGNGFSGNDYYNALQYSVDYDYKTGGVYAEPLSISGLRNKYTTIKGNDDDSFTVMVYMIASDLESNGGFATEDINEMLAAEFGDKVNVVIQTGGTTAWNNNTFDASTSQRWLICSDGFYHIEDLGQKNMTKPDVLSDFIAFGAKEFPANRYALILWDHGGGTMWGYGYDENYPNDYMDLHELDKALSDGGVKFDFVGFDACLMSTLETAYMLENHADYLISSEETEPGCGWYYTDWLTALNLHPSIDTVELGEKIIDDFVSKCSSLDYDAGATLSIVDLREIPYTYDQLCTYLEASSEELNNYHYDEVSHARNNARDYGEGNYQQVDIADLAYRLSLNNSDEVIAAIKSAVKYRNQTDNMRGSHGLAMYFPYSDYSSYNNVLDIQQSIGIGEEYTDFFGRFLNVMLSGRSSSARAEDNDSQYDWYDEQTVSDFEGEYNYNEYDELVINENNNGDFVLQLSNDQWKSITNINLEAYLDDGEGYVDLGTDNVWSCDENGDLLVEFDYTWVSVNGQTVSYYVEQEYDNGSDDWYTYGYSPANINGEYVEIIIYWDNENPDGYIAGYRPYYEGDGVATKGILPIEEGTEIQFVYDYYDYDWNYVDTYCLYDPIIMTSEPLTVSYEGVADYNALIWYKLTDIYQNDFYTESVVYY